ncbi:MAG TPA: hypothetical protein VFY71_11910 [Planctomycetota bacterium]|nr:hypothetical protein [Planctomycetota bacterium]
MEDDGGGPFGGVMDQLASLLDDVRDVARERAASVAQAARVEADRLEARLRWVALMAGACIGAGVLIVVGLSGALGEFAGRTWVGQLASGVLVILGVVAWSAVAHARNRKRAAEAKAQAEVEQRELSRNLSEAGSSMPLLAIAGAAGWVAGLFLSRRRGRRG